jgi:hypothetical protein
MARTEITITDFGDLVSGGSASLVFTSVINGGSGNFINTGGDLTGLVIAAKNTGGSASVLTLLAGDNPPAGRSGLGDLEVNVPETTGFVMVGGLESMRFNQNSAGSELQFDWYTAGSTQIYTGASVAAYRLPNYAG